MTERVQLEVTLTNSAPRTRTVWTARCKSGYQWENTRTKRIGRVLGVKVSVTRTKLKACAQTTGKGELMCEDCKALLHTARQLEEQRASEERMARALRAYVNGDAVRA